MAVDYGWQLPCYVAKELLILLVVTEEMRFSKDNQFCDTNIKRMVHSSVVVRRQRQQCETEPAVLVDRLID